MDSVAEVFRGFRGRCAGCERSAGRRAVAVPWRQEPTARRRIARVRSRTARRLPWPATCLSRARRWTPGARSSIQPRGC